MPIISNSLGVFVSGPCDVAIPIIYPGKTGYAVLGRTADGFKDPTAVLNWKGDPNVAAIQIAPQGQPSRDDYLDLLQLLECVRVHGGRVEITGGGKYVQVDQLRITGNTAGDYAFKVANHDGGRINANVHENFIGGMSIKNSHCLNLDVTARDNQAIGFSADWCGAISGRLYTESNGMYDQSWNQSARSRLDGSWQEAAWWQATPDPFYSRWKAQPPKPCYGIRRNCFDLDISGQLQADSNQAWDDDPVSWLFCPAPRRLQERAEDLAPYLITLSTIPKVAGWSNKQIEVPAAGGALIRANAFAGMSGANATIEFGSPALAGMKFQAGDSLVVEFSVQSPQWQYLSQQSMPTIRITTLGALQTPLDQNFWVMRPGQNYSYTWPTMFAADGQGPRIFVAPNIGVNAGPAIDVLLNIQMNVYVIPGAWK